MDLRQLRYFAEVALAHNFRGAAERLHISQSSLSRRVSELEHDLRTRLFDRHPRGVTLTHTGQLLLSRAEDLLREVESIRAQVCGDAGPAIGAVTVGTSAPLSRLLLAPLVAGFEKPTLRIHLRFVEGVQNVLYEGLDAGRIDLAVMTTPEPIPSCKMEVLIQEPLYFVSSPTSRSKKRIMEVAELDRIPLVAFPRPNGHHNYLERTAREHGVRLEFKYEIADTATQREFARLGLAACILPQSAVKGQLGRPRLSAVPISGLVLNRTLVWRGDRHQTAAVRMVADAIRKLMACRVPAEP